jgi:hypothetical protein
MTTNAQVSGSQPTYNCLPVKQSPYGMLAIVWLVSNTRCSPEYWANLQEV